MSSEMMIRVHKSAFSNHFDVAGFVEHGDSYSVVVNVEMKRHEDGLMVMPFASMTHTQAQTLMDDLWLSGVRPSEGNASQGQLKATQDHLKDMRKIAFNKLKINES